jgi:hypothetical protein
VDNLVGPPMRHPQQAGRISRTHLQRPTAQHPHGAARHQRRTPVFPIGLFT